MAGASLIPDYYKENIKLAMLLAPPAALSHTRSELIKLMAFPVNRDIIVDAVNTLHFWNFTPYGFLNKSGQAICKLFKGTLCNIMIKFIMDEDPKIDETSRYEFSLNYVPSGASYLNFVHYG